MRAVEPWRQMVPLLASWNVMELRRLREMYVIFCECASGRSARANLEVRKLMEPGKIPAEEEILAGRGGSPGGRLGGSGEASWRSRILLPGASVGDHASCAKWPKNGAKIVVFQREPARPPSRNPSPPGAPRLAPRGSV